MKMDKLLSVIVLGLLFSVGQLYAEEKPEVTPYGFILVNAGFNMDNPGPFDIPVIARSNPDTIQTFLITPRQTRFGFKMSGAEAMGAKLNGGIELDFFGLTGSSGAGGVTQSAPRLRRAFCKLTWEKTSLLIGQEWIFFAPLSPSSLAHVSIPEFSGSGNLWNRLPQVSLEQRMAAGEKGEVKLNVGLFRPFGAEVVQKPVTQSDLPGLGEKKGLPFLQARLGLSVKSGKDKSFTLGGNVHFGQFEVDDDNDNTFAAASDLALQAGNFGLKGEGFVGKGTNMLFSRAARGVGTKGGWGQATIKAEKVTLNGGYGAEILDEDDVGAGALSKNQTLFVNAIYAAAKHTKIAFEFGHIITSYKGMEEDENSNSLNLAFQYVF